jgi:hypothetical protein
MLEAAAAATADLIYCVMCTSTGRSTELSVMLDTIVLKYSSGSHKYVKMCRVYLYALVFMFVILLRILVAFFNHILYAFDRKVQFACASH